MSFNFIPNDSNYTELKFNAKVVVLAEEENQINNNIKKPQNDNLVQSNTEIINVKDLSKTGISIIVPMILFLSSLILLYLRKYNKKNNN